jgi:hypothetical protein
MRDTVRRIENFQDEKIARMVNRVPEEFLSKAERKLTVDVLIERKRALGDALGAKFGGQL